ncbi:MAG: LamG domain-containing protein [Cyclobacteriaceae bacterium]|nr:LamG domain-containing protein [Cyclobacteriaceae bacterium]
MNFPLNDVCVKRVASRTLLALTLIVVTFGFNGCSDSEFVPAPSVTELSKRITAGIKLVTSTYEGAATGNFPKGSRKILIDSIDSAQKIYVKTNITQALLTQSLNNLNTAIDTYMSKKVITVDPTNLVGQWTFDELDILEEGILLKDYSGKGNNAILKRGHEYWGRGLPTRGTDRNGNVSRTLHFDHGANIEIPYTPEFNQGQISISLWVKLDTLRPFLANQSLASLNRKNGYQLFTDNIGRAVFTVNPAATPGTNITDDNATVLFPGNWYHIAVTFGNGHMVFYRNGVVLKDHIHAGTTLTTNPGVNFVFGQDLPTDKYSLNPLDPNAVDQGGFLRGYLDELRVYKSVLTVEQVASIYAAEKP